MHAWYAATRPHTWNGLTTPVRSDGAGESVLCLHGFPTSSWDFEPLWGGVTERHHAIAFDLVGLGKASKPDHPLPVGLQADLAEDVMRRIGVREAHLLAHDLGDTVAQELLARQAEGRSTVTWRSAVFLNGGLFPETHRPRLIQRLLISPLGPWVARFSTERTFRSNMTRIFGPHTPPDEDFLKHGWELLVADGGRTALPHLIRYMAERTTQRERWVRPLIDRIVPMRVINGNLDPVSGRHTADRFAELVPEADIVHLADLGHYPHVERPETVLAPVLSFLQRLG
ncbi:MAG: alpha/beta hydrolase [Myxococcota bacterium]